MIRRVHYDDETLQALLSDSPGGDDDHDAVVAHVESCEACQRQLERLTQADVTLETVGGLLRDDSVDDALFVEHDPLSGEATPSALSFLDESERPDSLGTFGRYEVMEILGRGGMGIVMRGFDPALNRQSAIKVLAPEYSGSAAARRRFSREAKSAAAVVHPHVVPIQTVEEHNGLPYLVMPVVEGCSLENRVRETGPLQVIEVVRIASQVAEGLAAAHAQGLVHRDIKPGNVLLENGVERVQITDFGLARAADDASMTRSGIIAGTPQYMSPEQAHGDPVDHRSDLFSLGGLIYFMCTGRSPFRAETTMGVLKRIVDDEPRPLREINSDVPTWLAAIVDRLLEKQAADRFQSADEVAELLGQWLAHLHSPETADAPDGQATSSLQQPKAAAHENGGKGGNRWKLALAAAGLPLFAWLASVIWLETGRGKLRIETNSETPVKISIREGSEPVEELTVSSPGQTIRLYAGKYELQFDDDVDGLQIVNDDVTLTRGGQWVAKVQMMEPDDHAGNESSAEDKLLASLKITAAEFLSDLRDGRLKEAQAMLSPEAEPQLKKYSSATRNAFVMLEGLEFDPVEAVVDGERALVVFETVTLKKSTIPERLVPGVILKQVAGTWGIFNIDFIEPESAARELARWMGQDPAEETVNATTPPDDLPTVQLPQNTGSVGMEPAAVPADPEPIYAGEALSVWQQRFEAETNPVSRIEAATALVALSDRQTPKQQLKTMLTLGGRLVESGWGDQPNRYFSAYIKPEQDGFRPIGWSRDVYPDLYAAWDRFVDSVELRCEAKASSDSILVVGQMVASIEGDSLPEAMFATGLLKWLVSPFADDPQFCSALLATKLPYESKLWPHAHLALADFYPEASEPKKRRYENEAQSIAKELGSESGFDLDWGFGDKWLREQLENKVQLPDSSIAGTARGLLNRDPELAADRWFRMSILGNGAYSYHSKTMDRLRRYGNLWDVWLPEVTQTLKANSTMNEELRKVLSTLEIQLRLRRPDDKWPTQELVLELQNHLQNRTAEESKTEVISRGIDEYDEDGYRDRVFSAVTNHDILSFIVLAGGKLPDDALKVSVAEDDELRQLEAALADWVTEVNQDPHFGAVGGYRDGLKHLNHLLETNPVGVVDVAIRQLSKLPGNRMKNIAPILQMLTERDGRLNSPPAIEPLLLLALFAELPGLEAEADEAIVHTFQYETQGFKRHLIAALTSEYSSGVIAAEYLRRLRARTKNESLIDEINTLIPPAPEGVVSKIDEEEKGTSSKVDTNSTASSNIETPESTDPKQSPPVSIVVDSEGKIQLNGKEVDLKSLLKRLIELEAKPDASAVVAASSEVSLSQVTNIVSVAEQAGFRVTLKALPTQSTSKPRRTEPTPDIPLVQIRVTDEDGKPRPGVTVSLRLVSDNAKELDVESVSGKDSTLVLDRVLPYGRYYLRAETDDGWSCSIRDLNVEFDQGLQLTLKAPTPNQTSTLQINSGWNDDQSEDLQKLPFGALERHVNGYSGFFPVDVPGPGMPAGKYGTFPTLGDGIEEVGLRFAIAVRRSLKASHGETLEWTWRPGPETRLSFLLHQGGVQTILDNGYERVEAAKNEGYFSVPSNSESDIFKVLYHASQLSETRTLPDQLTLPAGEVTVRLTRVVGRPSAQAAKRLLGEETVEAGRTLWLPAAIPRESAWIDRLFPTPTEYAETQDWKQMTEGGLPHLLRREIALPPGKTTQIVIPGSAEKPST